MALQNFKCFIGGQRVKIFTDNKNITSAASKPSNRMLRWYMNIAEFNHTFSHVSAEENQMADALSRSANLNVPKKLQTPFLANVLKQKYKAEIFDDINVKIYIPKQTTASFLKDTHEYLGHPGINKMYETITLSYKIDGLKEKITQLISSCEQCQKNKTHPYGNLGKVSGNLGHTERWEKIGMDIFGPIDVQYFKTQSEKTKVWVLTIVDLCTRYTRIIPLWDTASIKIIQALKNNWLSLYKNPIICVTDNGSSFTSKEFKDFCRKQGIRLTNTSPYNPTANGIVERMNKAIAH
ncbi:transposable element, partial [Pseudoloma neurophilia]